MALRSTWREQPPLRMCENPAVSIEEEGGAAPPPPAPAPAIEKLQEVVLHSVVEREDFSSEDLSSGIHFCDEYHEERWTSMPLSRGVRSGIRSSSPGGEG